MTVQHQLEVYIENPVNKLCQLSKKRVHVIVSNLLCRYMYMYIATVPLSECGKVQKLKWKIDH